MRSAPPTDGTTAQWMVGLPKHGNPVGAVWARLAELERAGREDSAVIAALRLCCSVTNRPCTGAVRPAPNAFCYAVVIGRVH
jgi:hypothetical protein